MKALQSTIEEQSLTQASHESQSEHQNNNNAANEALAADSGSVSVSSNEGRKVSREDIELVQNLIERCLQLYMNKDEVVKTLLTRARIDPGFTSLVWQKLEEENADFFRAYYIRLKLKKQIIMFNHLIEHQYRMSKCTVPTKIPLAPTQNGIYPPPAANNLPMGYPVLQPHPVPVPGQSHSHLNPMGHEVSSCHMVKGVPAPGNFQPLRMNSANDMVIENSSVDAAPVIPPSSGMSTMSDMPVSPTSVASSGHFPFTAPEITGMEIPWTFSLSDLTADLSNLGDLGPLGNYPGSPFLPSDSDILLDSPEPEDIVEEFFVDSVPGPPCAPSDEEKP